MKRIIKLRPRYFIILVIALFLIGLLLGFFTLNQVKITKKPQPVPKPSPTVIFKLNSNDSAPIISDPSFRLIIQKLNLDVPVTKNVDGTNEKAYLTALEEGIAHFANTALPGRVGNTVIFGHSSYYANLPGNYKTIFQTLDELTKGDQLEIHYQNRQYLYEVVNKKIVLPSDVAILQQTLDQQLTLITCWPLGSTAKRLIIIAKRNN